MKVRSLAVSLILAFLVISWPAASSRYMSVDEVRPGMIGIGRTVFQGDQIEEFKVHILGVLKNVSGPRRDMVLARLEGGPLASTGVIAGMSGSPVYVDGRLLGAVAFSLGQFSKEPIAGITPIQEMVDSAGPQVRRSPADTKIRVEMPLTRESIISALRKAFARLQEPFAQRPDEVQVVGSLGASDDPRLVTRLRPIATPLTLGGFSGAMAETVSAAFQASGFVATDAATRQQGAAAAKPSGERLRPGDAVGVDLVRGDLSMGATGTVTEVDGNQVYAFGHPFYNLGPTEFPMTRAYVYSLLPSLSSSMKIAITGETIGTFQQDRATAVAGTLGTRPSLIPVHVALDTERGLKKEFTFEVVRDQLFTPLLTYVSLVNTLQSYEREYGTATFAVKGKATLKKYGDLAFEDVFAGDTPGIGAAASVVGPLTFLLGNDLEPVELDGVDLSITTSERPQTLTLDRVWLDTPNPKAGATVPLKIALRTWRGEEIVKTVPLDIPPFATGTLTVLVSDGPRLAQADQRDLRSASPPRSVAEMLRQLNRTRRNSRLYVRLLGQTPGAVVNGEPLPSLPPSVLGVMEADRNGGTFSPLRSATLGEWDLATDTAVSGSRTLTINLKSGN